MQTLLFLVGEAVRVSIDPRRRGCTESSIAVFWFGADLPLSTQSRHLSIVLKKLFQDESRRRLNERATLARCTPLDQFNRANFRSTLKSASYAQQSSDRAAWYCALRQGRSNAPQPAIERRSTGARVPRVQLEAAVAMPCRIGLLIGRLPFPYFGTQMHLVLVIIIMILWRCISEDPACTMVQSA